MADLVLMEKGAEQMNVPSAKVDLFLQNGWKEISRKPMPAELTQVHDAPIPETELVERKTADVKVEKSPKKADAKK